MLPDTERRDAADTLFARVVLVMRAHQRGHCGISRHRSVKNDICAGTPGKGRKIRRHVLADSGRSQRRGFLKNSEHAAIISRLVPDCGCLLGPMTEVLDKVKVN